MTASPHLQLRANGQTAVRVLTVLPDFPFPATTGLHLRMVSNLDLVHRLGCFSSLLYFTTEEREPPSVASTPLTGLCDEVRHGGRRFPHSNFSRAALIHHKLDFLVRGALGLPGTKYPFSMSYDRINACDLIIAEAKRTHADFVVLPTFMLHYAAPLRQHGFRVIADAIDVLTELSRSFLRNYASSGVRTVGLYCNFLACRTQERHFLPQCSEVWATSPQEADSLRKMCPSVNVLVVANTLDELEFNQGPSVRDLTAGFIGTYSSFPNLEAAMFLAEKVFPLVLTVYPGARLKLAGANMPESAETALRRLAYVDLLGAIGNSADLYGACRVVALPVFVRGGVPLKVVEALARGKAVVACPELVAGLGVSDGHDLLVRNNPEAFAKAICDLFSDDELCQRLGRNGRATFLNSWSRSQSESVLRQGSLLASFRPNGNHG